MTSPQATSSDLEVRTAFRPGFGGHSKRNTTALIVEDNFGSRVALTALLERVRLSVVAAESGHAALDVLKERDDIAIVLMDIMMPIMDGYDTMRAIRERPELAGLPIIAVTAKDGAGERERCIEAGASDYMPKPIDTPDLLERLTALTTRGEAAPTTKW
jgi:CheY-like chemotaxis protein